jgi:hypothetical protein
MATKDQIIPGVIFTHYKNKDYEIVTLAKDEASGEDVVVYRMLYGDYGVWTRRLTSFCEYVEINGATVERFKKKQ